MNSQILCVTKNSSTLPFLSVELVLHFFLSSVFPVSSVRLDCGQTPHRKMETGLLKMVLDSNHKTQYNFHVYLLYTILCIEYQIIDYSRPLCIYLFPV